LVRRSRIVAREGARLVLSGLPTDPVHDVIEAITNAGGQAVTHLGDLTEEMGARACLDLALMSFGKLDILVRNTNIFIANAATEDYRIEDFDRTVSASQPGQHYLHVFGGRIERLTQVHALWRKQGLPLCINDERRCLEQAAYGDRANCVCPGPIDTAWARGGNSQIGQAEQLAVDAMVPLGRRATTEEIANIFAFLASDEASYVTGAKAFARRPSRQRAYRAVD
jgi:NAD(P)-dependent dehydrogenase (short-subunit alcohol dehydrogenase family)